MTNLEALQTLAKAVFGAQWQRPTAKLLRIPYRTMNAYQAGKEDVPSAVVVRLMIGLERKADELVSAHGHVTQNWSCKNAAGQ